MIQYSLKCSNDHAFPSWFRSSDDFDTLKTRGLIQCPACGDKAVDKAIMAPRIGRSERAAPNRPADAPETTGSHALSVPNSSAEKALQELKKKIQQHSDYVGDDFAKQARAIHLGDAPERSIHGEATSEDARALIDDGVPVTPLPFMSSRKAN